jgi:hypothetical protein
LRIVYILRKPLSEGSITSNVLRHGTGAINIDACRISSSGDMEDGVEPGSEEVGGRPQPSGKWPRNVVMSHSPGCRLTGTRVEEGYIINRFKDGAKPFGGGAGHAFESTRVPNLLQESWECQPGCLVGTLERESRDGSSGGAPSFYKQVGSGTTRGE